MSIQAVRFAGTNLSQWLAGVTIERSLLPDVELSTVEVPAADGDVVAGRRLKAMEVRVNATLRGRTADEVSAYRHSLAAALDRESAGTLVLPDDPDVSYAAWVTGSTVMDRDHSNPHVTIAFHVPRADGQGASRTAPIGTSATTVTRGGNRRAWPVVRANPTSSPFRVTNSTTGKYVEARGSFSGGTLVIDMLDETVTYGGSACTFALASDFFALESQTQTLVATSAATMTWNERWL